MVSGKKYTTNIKIRKFKTGWFFLLALIYSLTSFAQLTPDVLQQYLLDNAGKKGPEINYRKEVWEFYACMGHNTAWIQQKDTANVNGLLDNLLSAARWGLTEKDYQYRFISAFKEGTLVLQTQADSLQAELYFSDAAIHFYHDIAFGNTIPSLRYTGVKYNPDCRNIPAILALYVLKKSIPSLAIFLSPKLEEVRLIRDKINWMVNEMQQKDFNEPRIVSTNLNAENEPLLKKLYQLGIMDAAAENISKDLLKQKIKEAQLMFNLPVNGELKQNLIRELNVPLQVRLQQLNLSINYYRWLSCLTKNQSVIVVNIPAAYLKTYHEEKVILEMRMVLGKTSTPTLTLSGIVDEVIVYPYWYVPLSIATKELLPAIKRNISFLNDNNYQVLDKAGKIVDPYSVNWNALSRNNFPYTIRQGTGCDNSLGLLKLNFYNPFGAYLHDTPAKDLFQQQYRFYSHGCMRMEKPIELGHLVLKDNHIAIDTITEKGCLKSQAPVIIPADVKMPVIVWYNPAGIDSTGSILFFEDVYKKFTWTKS